MTRTPLLLLTGFLGSGKTTLLNRLVRDERFRDTAVVVNEAGIVGLDHLLIECGGDGVVLLDGGCLCCRMDGSLAVALAALLRRRRPDGTLPFSRVVVETSGLADPGPILQSLIADIVFNRHFVLAGITTIVDAQAFAATVAQHPEAMMQVTLADRLIVTKADLVEAAALVGLQRRLARLNDQATQIVMRAGMSADRLWAETFDLTRPADHAHKIDLGESRRDIARITTSARRFAGAIAADDLDDWLEATLALFGPALLRLKGILQIQGRREAVVLHAVQGFLHGMSAPPRAPDDADNRMVLIGRDIDAAVLGDALDDLVARFGPVAAAPRIATLREGLSC